MWRRLRAALESHRTLGRFRDAASDFDISADRLRDYAGREPAGVQGPYVYELSNYVSLHLVGDPMAVQSVMDHRTPERLLLAYTQIMAGFPKYTQSPGTIGMIGLGGGSLVKHCRRHFPASRITVAEISAEVLALRREFRIPEDDSKLRVLHMDGAELVRRHTAAFDVFLIDAFDESGYPEPLATREFYQDCHRALSEHGVLVINLSGYDWRTWFRRLDAVFDKRVVLYRCPEGSNIIAFASKAPLPDWASRAARG